MLIFDVVVKQFLDGAVDHDFVVLFNQLANLNFNLLVLLGSRGGGGERRFVGRITKRMPIGLSLGNPQSIVLRRRWQ